MKKGTLWLKRAGKIDHDPFRGRRCESRRTAARATLTVFSSTDGCGRQESCRIRRKKRNERHFDALSRAVQAVAHEVKTRERSQDGPRSRQILLITQARPGVEQVVVLQRRERTDIPSKKERGTSVCRSDKLDPGGH